MKTYPDATDEGMDELYAPGKQPPKSVDEQEAAEMETTAIVPLKLVTPQDGKGVKVGDEVMVRITAINGDQATIEYAHGGKEPEGQASTPGEDMSADEELESIDASNYK